MFNKLGNLNFEINWKLEIGNWKLTTCFAGRQVEGGAYGTKS
ncbi:MAG: hypothetical protein UT24_C0043G0014 [Candidatus Woesebacteria bacterium GW2011_GWB1_39_12]|uniref:Uncharacterized protein n=1 Tax=Candidatus Woesebacteria bacterium GW2011_GWB1_39_12 TaxID=1618574 RepID=A0A0G0MBW3_9BACT|nr:MAG: hypothetical protein UT24_C0043G0014 [Candidatus Woesebacteria bacterium GW2011_GWB1_39_12]